MILLENTRPYASRFFSGFKLSPNAEPCSLCIKDGDTAAIFHSEEVKGSRPAFRCSPPRGRRAARLRRLAIG